MIKIMIYYLLSEKNIIDHNKNVSVRMCFGSFEAWAKLAQQCVPIGIHLEITNKELINAPSGTLGQ